MDEQTIARRRRQKAFLIDALRYAQTTESFEEAIIGISRTLALLIITSEVCPPEKESGIIALVVSEMLQTFSKRVEIEVVVDQAESENRKGIST